MVNGTEIDQFVEAFSASGWTTFVEFWVVIVAMSVIPFIMLINNRSKKSNLVFRPVKTEKEIEKKQGKVFYTQVDFWINVTNKGNTEAKNCHAFLTLMDGDFKENILWQSTLPQYTVTEPFSVPWHFLDTKTGTVDIPISNKSGYAIKIPFMMELLQTSDKEWLFGDIEGWEDPIQELNNMGIEFPQQYKAFKQIFGIVVEVVYENNKTVKKKFLIKIPHNKKTEYSLNDPSTIEFVES